MFKAINSKVAINLIVGSLGAGKTTLIKNLLKQKPHTEKWAILVNEFGAIGIDGAILETSETSEDHAYHIQQIPGGCICCTALAGFQDAVKAVMQEFQPTRIFIEPTGIGEPESMVDLLNNAYFQNHFDIQTIFAVIDSKITKVEQFKQLMIMQNLVDVADVIVFNKIDTASADNVKALNAFANQLYPAKLDIINTQNAIVDIALLTKAKQDQHSFNLSLSPPSSKPTQSAHHQQLSHSKPLPPFKFANKSKLEDVGLINRKAQQQLNTLSIGWVFNPKIQFDWKKCLSLFESLTHKQFSAQSPLRAKGVFRIGEPSMLFQWVNEQSISREFIAYKRDSRLEILLPDDTEFNIESFEKELKKCIKK